MKLNSKGQVTIPAELRRTHGFMEGDEVDVIADGPTLRIVHSQRSTTRGERIVERMPWRATSELSRMSADDIMALLRDE